MDSKVYKETKDPESPLPCWRNQHWSSYINYQASRLTALRSWSKPCAPGQRTEESRQWARVKGQQETHTPTHHQLTLDRGRKATEKKQTVASNVKSAEGRRLHERNPGNCCKWENNKPPGRASTWSELVSTYWIQHESRVCQDGPYQNCTLLLDEGTAKTILAEHVSNIQHTGLSCEI